MRGALNALCAVVLVLGPGACSDRDLSDDGMDAEPIEHPPELLERYLEACEDSCAVYERCTGEESACGCLDREFDHQPQLCVEKAALLYECQRTLTCEGLDLDHTLPVQDDLCWGQRVAEAGACK